MAKHPFGGLRALPPENDSHPAVPRIESPGSVAMQGPNGVTCQQEAAVAPLPDRIDALNSSLDPWERTGAAPQGWATHLYQAMVPIQGYIQLRPQTEGTLPAFGFASQSPSGDKARLPPRCQPCDVGVEHDDHTCYSCEQRLLHPEGVPGAPWRPPLAPGCESWCAHCTSQRCAVRGFHELHVCVDCGGGWRSLGCS